MYEQTAYRCSYCHKYGLSKGWIKKHEDKCFKNPATRSCATCANLHRVKIDHYNPFNHTYDTYPECLAGINLENVSHDKNDPRSNKYALNTDCKYWVERPEEEEELVLYQISKVDAISDSKDKPEIPF